MSGVDLNSDVGEYPERIADGTQEAIMRQVTSVNVACGAHAGDDLTLLATLEMAKKLGLAVGAHPSYPDRENFGRARMDLPPAELSRSITEQLRYLGGLARQAGVQLGHVKPHGALYNAAADDSSCAEAICEGVARFDRSLVLVGLASSQMITVFRTSGFAVAGEAFIDRRYERNARLRSRKLKDSLITDCDTALQQAQGIVQENRALAYDGTWIGISAQTLCIHSDTPGAAEMARFVRNGLESAGVRIAKLIP